MPTERHAKQRLRELVKKPIWNKFGVACVKCRIFSKRALLTRSQILMRKETLHYHTHTHTHTHTQQHQSHARTVPLDFD